MRTFAVDHPTQVTMSRPTKKRCPFVEEIDDVTVTVHYVAEDKVVELHDLAAYIDSFEDVQLSHEDFAQGIRTRLLDEGIDPVVRVAFRTAGFYGHVTVPSGRRIPD